MLTKFRLVTSLSLALLTLLTFTYFYYPTNSPEYTDHWMRSDMQMLMADGGGSKMRFIKSHSAGQYDVTAYKHVNQEYEGVTRTQFEMDELAGKHLLVQPGQLGGADANSEIGTPAWVGSGGSSGSGGKGGNVDTVSEVSEKARAKLREMTPMLDLWGSLNRQKKTS